MQSRPLVSAPHRGVSHLEADFRRINDVNDTFMSHAHPCPEEPRGSEDDAGKPRDFGLETPFFRAEPAYHRPMLQSIANRRNLGDSGPFAGVFMARILQLW